MKTGTLSPQTGARRVALIVLTALIASCGLLNGGQYVQVTAGIVREVVAADTETRFELEGGQTVIVASTTEYLGGTSPQLGELLLAGTQPERWVYRARPVGPIPDDPSPMCYEVIGETTANATQVFKTVHDAARGDVVIVFPKAAAWSDLGSLETRNVLLGNMTCLNERGEAFEQRIGR